MADEKLKFWISKELMKVLKLSEGDKDYLEDMAGYMLGIESQDDMKEYLTDLLGDYRKGSAKDVFTEQLFRRWHPHAKLVHVPDDMMGYRKKDAEEVLFAPKNVTKAAKGKDKLGRQGQTTTTTSSPSSSSSDPQRSSAVSSRASQQGPPAYATLHADPAKAVPPASVAPPGFSVAPGQAAPASASCQATSSGGAGPSGGRRRKYVAMTTARTTALRIPGRHQCSCQASRHPLVSNCTRCGRIVCGQEGAGPCLFCGELVCAPDDREVLARDSKRSAKLREKLMAVPGGGALQAMSRQPVAGLSDPLADDQSSSPALRKAKELKERLLDFDKTSVQRTKVIDDESDYFTADTNTWLGPEDKKALQSRQQELREQRHAPRSQRKVTIDFAGRRVVEDEDWKMKQSDALYGGEDAVLKAVEARSKKQASPSSAGATSGKGGDSGGSVPGGSSIANPTVEAQLTYVEGREPVRSQQVAQGAARIKASKGRVRVQDKELLEMRDEGVCLSMHQPWATLLIAGIKMDEGRSWYTSHRGRLWIAAAAKPVDQQDISSMECFYGNRSNGAGVVFPKEFPTGCLLGCVDVDECLAQDEYRKKFPNGESESPYVWVCSNPQELLITFPMKGKHKLWKVEGTVHKSAQRCLQ